MPSLTVRTSILLLVLCSYGTTSTAREPKAHNHSSSKTCEVATFPCIVGGNWRIFKFNSPTVSMNSAALLFPSLTDSCRYRTNLNLSLRRELVKDFYLDLSFYHAYDSQPPDVNAENSDYGLTTSLGYSFY